MFEAVNQMIQSSVSVVPELLVSYMQVQKHESN